MRVAMNTGTLHRFDSIDLQPKFESFAYQLNAVHSVSQLEYAALFHEQGLGKTKIALDLVVQWLKDKVVDSVILVTKKSLMNNWQEEIENHVWLKFVVLDNDRIRSSRSYNRPYRIYLTHYEAVSSNEVGLELFLKTRRVGAILDEAHRIKNPDGKITRSFLHLSRLFIRRVIMTGTPVANRPQDIWAQIYFLDHGKSLGEDFQSFKKKYDIPKKMNAYERENYEYGLTTIFCSVESFSVRETKESAGIELPHKRLVNVDVELEQCQRILYSKYKEQIRVEIFRNGCSNPTIDDVESTLKKLLRLVQVASNPILVDDSYSSQPGKFDELLRIIEGLEDGGKIVVWTNFILNSTYLVKKLNKFGALKLNGKMSMEERATAVQKFKSDSSKRVLVATPGAAKEGLTLTVANTAVFFDRNFSLNDWLQAQDRIHRISQTKPCTIYHLLALDTIDKWVDELLLYKRRVAGLAQGDISDVNKTFEKIDSESGITNIIAKVVS